MSDGINWANKSADFLDIKSVSSKTNITEFNPFSILSENSKHAGPSFPISSTARIL